MSLVLNNWALLFKKRISVRERFFFFFFFFFSFLFESRHLMRWEAKMKIKLLLPLKVYFVTLNLRDAMITDFIMNYNVHGQTEIC